MLLERKITQQLSETAPTPPEQAIAALGDPALQAKDITVSLHGRKLLKDVSLSVQPNEIMAIIGPSGCGKTTFLTTLNRMIHHTLPAATVVGDIILNGQRVFPSDENPADLRCKIAMIFQRPNPFPFSIRMNMEFALKAAGDRDKASYADKIEKNLRAVNLWDALKDRLNDTATSLSGGEQQRLCIARALLSDPDVVLFDEPCSALDPISSTAVEELISELKTERSIVIVTHNLAQAARISDRCAFFFSVDGSGGLMEQGPTHQIMNNPRQETTRAYVNGEVC